MILHGTHRVAAAICLAVALVLTGTLAAGPALGQSSQPGVYETAPIEPLHQRPYRDGRSLLYGLGTTNDPNLGDGVGSYYGQPYEADDQRGYSGQPGFGYHQPYRYQPHRHQPPAGYAAADPGEGYDTIPRPGAGRRYPPREARPPAPPCCGQDWFSPRSIVKP